MSDPRKPVRHQPIGSPKADAIEYGGYRLALRSHGSVGWKVFIYPPGGVTALETMPHSQAPDSRDAMIAEAKQVAERHHTRRR